MNNARPSPARGQKWGKRWDRFVAFGTLVAVVAYAILTYQQWKEMIAATGAATTGVEESRKNRQQSEQSFVQTLGQMQAQTDNMGRLAKASERSANISREALIETQRPFVAFAGTMSGKTNIIEGKVVSLTISVPWFNQGSGATRSAKSVINWMAEPFGQLPDDFSFPDIREVEKRQFYVGSKAVANATADIPVHWIESVVKEHYTLFVYGWMTYHDGFSGTPTRLSEFCIVISDMTSSIDELTNPSVTFSWANPPQLCRRHNCNDDECEDYTEAVKR
jgi:hypothetical protein